MWILFQKQVPMLSNLKKKEEKQQTESSLNMQMNSTKLAI